jgi:hypothetical protein
MGSTGGRPQLLENPGTLVPGELQGPSCPTLSSLPSVGMKHREGRDTHKHLLVPRVSPKTFLEDYPFHSSPSEPPADQQRQMVATEVWSQAEWPQSCLSPPLCRKV